MDYKVNCSDCGKIYANSRSLANHRRRFHNQSIEENTNDDVSDLISVDINQEMTDTTNLPDTNKKITEKSELSVTDNSNDESNQTDSVDEEGDQGKSDTFTDDNNDQQNVDETTNDDETLSHGEKSISDCDCSECPTNNLHVDRDKTNSTVTDSESDALSVKSRRTKKAKYSRKVPYKRNVTPNGCRMSDKKTSWIPKNSINCCIFS